MAIPIEQAVFKAAGATVGRRLDQHVGDVVNVKNFGALGNNSNDDGPAIQAAFDYAFGTAASPHGVNSSLNKPVFFPGGAYKVGSTLVLTAVKNGHIFGAVASSITPWDPNVDNFTILRINGMEDSRIENIGTFFAGNQDNGIGMDIDWDGVTSPDFGVSLGRNLFRKVGCGGNAKSHGHVGFRIGNSGHSNGGQAFWNCVSEACDVGFYIVSGDGHTFQALCGGAENNICWKIDSGSMTVTGVSNAGADKINPAGGQLDFQLNGAATVIVMGGRSEANRFMELNHASAKAHVCAINCGNNVNSDNIIMVPGSTLVADELFTFRITGNGTLYKRGGSFALSGSFVPSGPHAPALEQDI